MTIKDKEIMKEIHKLPSNGFILVFFWVFNSDGCQVILPLRNSSDDFLKSMAVLTLVYLVDEKDNAKLVGETSKYFFYIELRNLRKKKVNKVSVINAY